MPKFTVNAEPSICEPIEVEINGHTYSVRKISRRMLREIDAAQKEAEASAGHGLGSAESIFRQVELLLGEEAREDVDTLDLFEAGELVSWIASQYVQKGVRATVAKPEPAAAADVAADSGGGGGEAGK